MEILKPYRRRIDEIDAQLLELFRARYDVIDAVSTIKEREGIDAVLPERVDEVRENAARRAAELGLDEAFIRDLWAQLIEHSCRQEERYMRRKKAGA